MRYIKKKNYTLQSDREMSEHEKKNKLPSEIEIETN